jgi:flagella basal body P-ring formation protein FlgA
MGCFAERRPVLLVVAFAATLATALAALCTFVDAAAVPGDASARAVAAIAERWGVPASDVRTEWSEPLPFGVMGELTLRGNGAQGHWLVDIRAGDGTLHRGRLRAGVVVQAPHAVRDLPRGATIAEQDIAWTESVAWGPPQRGARASVEGWTTRRIVIAGEALATPAVAPPVWVRSGEDVRVIVVRGTLELAMTGRAAGTGAAGERVAVRASTGRRLTGTITAPGVVRVDAGKDL